MKSNKLLTVCRKGLVLVILFFTLSGLDVKAQNPDQPDNSSIAARLIRYEVKPEFQEIFRKAISDYVRYSIIRATNILTEGYYEQDNPSVLWIIERWSDKAELDKISSSIQFKVIDSLSVIGLLQLATVIYVQDLEPLSKQQWRNAAGKDDKPITIMLFVDSKPGTESTFEKVYHKAMPLFRSEPGVINYQLSRFETDRTRFVTYEKFRDEAAFQYHLNFPPIQPVIDYLNTNIKKQPFQDGLHTLIEFAPLNLE